MVRRTRQDPPAETISTRTIKNAEGHETEIRIIRSKRRKKTISAKIINWFTLEIRAPADISERELERAITHFQQHLDTRHKRSRTQATDEKLEADAKRLNQKYFAGKLRWQSIRYVSNQAKRFGSCSPATGTVRISDRLRHVPEFVLDYVLMHELAHLIEANHSRAFWDLVYRYPMTERARGYLMALQLEDDHPNPPTE